jgi:DNA-binding MltR family transcriptional regulator
MNPDTPKTGFRIGPATETSVKLRPLSETHPHLEEFSAFLEALNKESDRGAALICAAMLDDILEKTLAAFLIDNKDSKKLFTGFNAPLGTFSARILAAYSLGLISEEEYDECNRIRLIRNEFAHHIHQDFAGQKVSALCDNLKLAARGFPAAQNVPRGYFLTASTALILRLTNRPHYVKQKRLKFGDWKI